MERRWPLTGRDPELRAVAAAVRPGAAGILVAGPAGVGKTRLVREALDLAPRRGARVVWALGSVAGRPTPFGAFAGLLDLPAGEPAGGVTRLVDHLAGLGRVVLAVDDAHLLDELSALVLHRVVVRGLAPVVVTLRDPAPAPDVVTALWKDDLLPRLDLAPLDAPTTATLATRALQGPLETRSAHRLWSLTGGSPLFLRHLLTQEVASGRLSPASGLWLWSGAPEVSAELATLVDREIGALAPDVLDVVDLVTLGEPLDWETLTAVAAQDAVEQAEHRGLVRSHDSADGVVARLGHPMYGEVRRARMGTARARRLRGRLAARLDDAADPIARAVLLLDSDLPADHALLLRAAQAATALYDLPLAERIARAAAAGGGWEARLVHAGALSWSTRGEEAEAVLRDLVADAPTGGLRARAQAYRTGNLLFTLRRADAAEAVLAKALAHPCDGDGDGDGRLVLEAMAVALDAACGRVEPALARGSALLAGGLPDELSTLLVASALAATGAVAGRLDVLGAAAAAAAGPRPLHGVPAFGLTDWLVAGYRLAGLPATGHDVADGLVAAAADLPGPAQVMGRVLAGHAALAAGRPQDAVGPLRDAWATLERSEHEFRFRCRTLLATAYGQVGRAVAARPLLDGQVHDRHPAYTLFAPDDLLARAWVAAAEGAVTQAVHLAEGAAALARAQQSPASEVLAWQTAVQLGAAAPAERRLTALEAQVGGPRAGQALRHARALAGGDADELLAASAGWEGLGDLVAAVDAAAQASDLHRGAGRLGSALSAAARARVLADRSGACTPALLAAVHPLPLTARERESAVLAARGLSNRAIAERLTVSVRTVEGHLYRAGRKLGVSDRSQLAARVGTGEPE